MDAASELRERGFVVLRDAVASDRMERLANAYTDANASATDDDIKIGSASTRVNDFVNRGSAFDDLYIFPAPDRGVLSGHRPAVKTQFVSRAYATASHTN